MTSDAADRELLLRMRIARADESVEFEPLPGGVSSDIRVVRAGDRTVVLKRALEKLKVVADWHAPIERSRAEARWLEFVSHIAPDAVPEVLAVDAQSHAIAMEFLPPEQYPNWKTQLLSGLVDVDVAGRVGQLLGRIHAASAATPELAARFDNQDAFESLRIEPYLRRTAAAEPRAAGPLAEVIAMLERPGRVLVHGDVSPKNILIGASSPVLLDAECATWSDPAFDAAFCLTHLGLKAVHLPERAPELRAAASELRRRYLDEVDWEPASDVDRRISRILPALMLARVAGASPVEYLDESERQRVRATAIELLNRPVIRSEGDTDV
ncbi:phosphotransferase family protein [Microbacterium sp. NPDC057650]|uniref:phosphotransferase family protein n=1 Tax=unclassified Microbacterium TaxID=2609290 RepID=UPI00366EEB82